MKKAKNIVAKLKKTFFSSRKRKLITLGAILLIAYFQYKSINKPDFVDVEIYQVVRSDFTEKITSSGEIMAEKAIDLSFLSAGEVKEVFVNDGDFVKEGQKIARLDTTITYQSYLQAEANLRAAEAALAKVYDDLQGHEKDETFAQISTRTAAEVAKDNAYRSLIAASKNLSNSIVTAPFDGVINFKSNIATGVYSSPVASSFVFIDPNSIYFEAEVSEVEVTKLNPDSVALITLDAFPDDQIGGKIRMIGFVSQTTSTGGTAYKVKINMPLSDKNYRLGMNGDIEFILKTNENALSVPITAVSEENGNEYVWIVKADDKVVKREIQTGESSIDSTEIISGLEEGEKVLVRPPSKIEEGNRIQAK